MRKRFVAPHRTENVLLCSLCQQYKMCYDLSRQKLPDKCTQSTVEKSMSVYLCTIYTDEEVA